MSTARRLAPGHDALDAPLATPVAAATAGAACRRCGRPDEGDAACPRCGMPWVSGVPAVVDVLPPDVRGATTGRSAAVLGVDLLPVLALVAVDVAVAGSVRWLLVALTVVYLVVLATVWARTGRTPARRLLGMRSVDARTGEPVGVRRLVGRLARGRRSGLLLADLRAGTDPLLLPVPTTAEVEARRRAARRDDPSATASPADRALQSYAGRGPGSRVRSAGATASVGLVLGNGQRHEVTGVLLLGRSPADAAGEGAVLVPWPDLSRRLAKTHLRAERRSGLLWVTDLGSVAGTSLVGPDGQRRTLEPGVPSAAVVGTTIECGGRTVRVVQGA